MSPIERSGGSGGATGAASLIFHSQLAADAGSIDSGAASIPATFTHLLVLAKTRTNEAAVNSTIKWNFNNDTTASYDRFAVTWNGAAVAAGSAYGQTSLAGDSLGNNADANRFAAFRGFFIDYADTTQWKQIESTGVEIGTAADANVRTAMGIVWTYRTTTAISRIAVANLGGTSLKAGSSLTIYGLQ